MLVGVADVPIRALLDVVERLAGEIMTRSNLRFVLDDKFRLTSDHHTLAMPLKSVLSSWFQPASRRLLTSHSGFHPKGRNALISAAINNLPS
jgi:hypothetical protein